mgnify:CR=1 FL=1
MDNLKQKITPTKLDVAQAIIFELERQMYLSQEKSDSTEGSEKNNYCCQYMAFKKAVMIAVYERDKYLTQNN